MKTAPKTSEVALPVWVRTSRVWHTARRVLKRMRQRYEQAARQSVIVKALARSIDSARACPRQAMGCVIAGVLCTFVGLMVFGARSLGMWEVAVRVILLLGVLGALIVCAESAGK